MTTESLTKYYGQIKALDGCTFGAEQGEVFGLLGPNGSGKTTLLRILLGFLKPTSGKATIDTLDCASESLRVRQRASYLPGDVRLFRRMRGRNLLEFFARLRQQMNGYRLEQITKRLQLDTSRKVGNMSTGMRQKLALAVVFSADTPLLILDEPTSNLDPNIRTEVLALIHEAKDEGRTVLFSSHVLSEVEAVCDRVAILRHGSHVHTQKMAELRRQHRIRANLTGPMSDPPESLTKQITIRHSDRQVTMDTAGELSHLLGWLAALPLAEVKIEPVGLRSVYEEYHPPEWGQNDLLDGREPF
ncbi:MAG: ABC transporter ATP-binding protein [Pirellulales bacterium]|nr:ABC transporter ATP-binding protein [Pirellulales bacterium]